MFDFTNAILNMSKDQLIRFSDSLAFKLWAVRKGILCKKEMRGPKMKRSRRGPKMKRSKRAPKTLKRE